MNSIPRLSRLIVAATLMAGSPGSAFAAAAIAPVLNNGGAARNVPGRGAIIDRAAQARALARYRSLPLFFEKNRGQTAASVKFFARARGYSLYLTATEAVIVMPPAEAAKTKAAVVVRMKMKGANAEPSVRGRAILPGHTSYLLGNNAAKWRTGAEHFAEVEISQVYSGIDMVYYAKHGQVEHDFIVAPGADPGRILIGFEGSKSLRLDRSGNLIIGVEGGELTYNAPELYQMAGAKRVAVKGRFVLAGGKSVRIAVGDYIKSKELVIDPALAYSSFLGGTTIDEAFAIAVDAAGNAYVTGQTNSNPFPGVAGEFQSAFGVGATNNVFVSKINAAGTALLWSTYIGGTGADVGNAIAVDGANRVYVTGSTTNSGTDAFVAALNADGKTAVYVDVFGGPGTDVGNGIAVTPAGVAYVTGATNSSAINTFPVTAGAAQTTAGGASDAFVAEFTAAGAQVYATYLGGVNADSGNAIAIDGLGNAYVTGQCGDTFVAVAAFPTVFKNTITGATDAFIAVLNAAGSAFTYKTYVGGSGIDSGSGIAVDGSGNIYITGFTFSADFPGAGFVTVGQTTISTAPDAFVFKLHPGNPGGGTNDGVYATFLGGSGDDRATAIALDAGGDVYLTGTTTSGDFPSVGPIAGGGALVGSPEAFVAEIGPTGGTVGFSTYLGGTGPTNGQGIALDSANNIYVTGFTNSNAATFPLQTPFQAANAGVPDAFVTKFGPVGAPGAACSIFNDNPNSGFSVGGTTVTITGSGFASLLLPGVTFGGIAASTFTVNATSTVITAVTPPHAVGLTVLKVQTAAGTCSTTYQYVVAPLNGAGSCGTDSFFPSPATGPTATFAYCMGLPGTVRIRVYNVIGDIVAKVENTTPAGAQLAPLNTARLAPGVYMYVVAKDYGGGNVVQSKVEKFVVKH